MAENTKIQWANHTFNPWRGCTKVAPECQFCYADTQSRRNPGVLGVWGPSGTRVVAAESTWREPLKWNREAQQAGERRRVFCASLGDVFEDWQQEMRDSKGRILHRCRAGHIHSLDAVYAHGAECQSGCNRAAIPLTMDDVRRRVFDLIDATPWLDWLLLTKRPENIRRMMMPVDRNEWSRRQSQLPWGDPSRRSGLYRPNVWLITSAGTQATADEFIPELLKCRDLVPVLGVSAEPLLGPVDFSEWLPDDEDQCCPECDGEVGCKADGTWKCIQVSGFYLGCGWRGEEASNRPSLDFVIVGGESGHNARPCDVAWIRSILDQCKAAGVRCFVKQLGSKPVITWGELCEIRNPPAVDCRPETTDVFPLRDPKGGDPAEWPEDLRIREFPKSSEK